MQLKRKFEGVIKLLIGENPNAEYEECINPLEEPANVKQKEHDEEICRMLENLQDENYD